MDNPVRSSQHEFFSKIRNMNWMVLLVTGLLLRFCICNTAPQKANSMPEQPTKFKEIKFVEEIALPHGYKRCVGEKNSFAGWLRRLPVKKDRTVYLYNGLPKANQTAQVAVLDMPVGNRDLQQCADAVMRLRASYLYEQAKFNEIVFYDNARRPYRYTGNKKDSIYFERYLENVFAYCGTLSLQKQLKPVSEIQQVMPGDVLIKGGSPGHAVIVLDVAENKNGEKIYLLAQSYMPAQDIHILRNPANNHNDPWYTVSHQTNIITPEWVFTTRDLRRW